MRVTRPASGGSTPASTEHERGLAVAVAADDADPVAVVDAEADAVEQGAGAERLADRLEVDEVDQAATGVSSPRGRRRARRAPGRRARCTVRHTPAADSATARSRACDSSRARNAHGRARSPRRSPPSAPYSSPTSRVNCSAGAATEPPACRSLASAAPSAAASPARSALIRASDTRGSGPASRPRDAAGRTRRRPPASTARRRRGRTPSGTPPRASAGVSCVAAPGARPPCRRAGRTGRPRPGSAASVVQLARARAGCPRARRRRAGRRPRRREPPAMPPATGMPLRDVQAARGGRRRRLARGQRRPRGPPGSTRRPGRRRPDRPRHRTTVTRDAAAAGVAAVTSS